MNEWLSAACLLLGLAQAFSAAGADVADFYKPSPERPVSSAGLLLIARLKQLADAGLLFSPTETGKVLQVELSASTTEAAPQPPSCNGRAGVRSRQLTRVEPAQTWWYQAVLTGGGSIEVPEHGMTQRYVTGEPRIAFQITRLVFCTDVYRLQDHTSAELVFQGLPSFACVTRNGLKKALPEVKPRFPSDGPLELAYEPPADDEFGVTLKFDFDVPACAVRAVVSQDQEAGLRFKRAQYAYLSCRLPVDRDYCSTAPSFSWSDGEAIDKMNENAAKICGSLNDNYLKEPATHEPAKRLPDSPRRTFPCDIR